MKTRNRFALAVALVAITACSTKEKPAHDAAWVQPTPQPQDDPDDSDGETHYAPSPARKTRSSSPGRLARLFGGRDSSSTSSPPPVAVAAPAPEPAPDYSGLNVVNGKPYADMFFKNFGVNPTIDTDEEATSTFAIDVDTASYAVSRSFLNRGHLPDEDAVRVEEFVNSFDYDYAKPGEETFSVQMEAFPSPNRGGYHVLHVGLKGKDVAKAERKNANLVFVIDVSGSMAMETRLELVKKALRLLVNELDERDTVGIVTYGDSAQDVLDPTPATKKQEILAAIDGLHTSGSTNVQSGIKRGYKMLSHHYRQGWINRVILCSDGVANNGITNADKIFASVKEEAKDGMTISTVGFGMGNYNDVLMERLADIGDGNYAYVDSLDAARKIFVEQLTGTLQVIAKDVKIQLEFDPKQVSRYRLLGFENRQLEKHQFDDDKIDAGEIGAGHTVTAIYEVKFTDAKKETKAAFAMLRVRHKVPEGGASTKIEKSVPFTIVKDAYGHASAPTRLSFVAAGFAEKLRGSYWVRNMEWDDLMAMWNDIPDGLRSRKDVAELGDLIRRAKSLDTRGDKFEKYGPIAEMDFDNVPVLE